MKEYTPNGILYTLALAGPSGLSFTLFPDKHTLSQINTATRWIRDNHDVIRVSIAQEVDYDLLYRSDILALPEIKNLHWYQKSINNMKLLREFRLRDMSPEQYAELCVFPNIEKVEKENLAKHGNKIYKQ